MTYRFVHAFTDLGVAKGPRLAVTYHMAEGGGTVGYLAKPNPNGVSVHFVVEYDGEIVQMLRLDHMQSSIRTSDIRTTDDPPYDWKGESVRYGKTAAERILGPWADLVHGTSGPNHATIGVEVEGFAAKGPNAAQIAAIRALAADLGIPALGHRDFADYKACPGKAFPWDVTGGHATKAPVGVPVRNYVPDTTRPMVQFGIKTDVQHALLVVETGALEPIDPTNFGVRGGLPAKLTENINAEPGGDERKVGRITSYPTGKRVVFVLESDIVVKGIDPPSAPPVNCDDKVAAALELAAIRAKEAVLTP